MQRPAKKRIQESQINDYGFLMRWPSEVLGKSNYFVPRSCYSERPPVRDWVRETPMPQHGERKEGCERLEAQQKQFSGRNRFSVLG